MEDILDIGRAGRELPLRHPLGEEKRSFEASQVFPDASVPVVARRECSVPRAVNEFDWFDDGPDGVGGLSLPAPIIWSFCSELHVIVSSTNECFRLPMVSDADVNPKFCRGYSRHSSFFLCAWADECKRNVADGRDF